MSFPFNAHNGPIIVEASLSGPLGQADLRVIVDTGATTSLIRSTLLVAVGYTPDAATDRVQVTMGNGIETVPRLVLNRFSALGKHRLGLPVLCYVLPPSAGIDGLLGLDFLRGSVLTIDFQNGLLALS
jgi:predicted aspartyl protease